MRCHAGLGLRDEYLWGEAAPGRRRRAPRVNSEPSVLLTDLYQLTMAHAYFELGMRETAVFELFVRRLPRARAFLLTAGLEQVVGYLEGLHFSAAEVEFLDSMRIFPQPFLEHLSSVRFTGCVHAMAEGTPFFANEPIPRVTAPILEAQLVESRILNLVHFQSLIASKAARCTRRARHISPDSTRPRRSRQDGASAFPCREPWRTRSSRPTITRSRHSGASLPCAGGARRC
jgi:nicotinic acid phosphoribosyltransferase